LKTRGLILLEQKSGDKTNVAEHPYVLAPRVSEPVEALQLVIPQLQVLTTNVRRLLLQSNEPWSLLQYLEKKMLSSH